MQEELIPRRGNYKNLLSYQKADVIYRLTFFFCEKFMSRGDRTVDQMIQAARSGKQNIAEGCAASATSAKTEIRLTNVAKASLKELLADFEDYMHTRNHPIWAKGSKEYETMRRLGREQNDAEFFIKIAESRPAETIANMTIILLNQADYLLHRQLERLSADFLNEGGFSERMHRMRSENRKNH